MLTNYNFKKLGFLDFSPFSLLFIIRLSILKIKNVPRNKWIYNVKKNNDKTLHPSPVWLTHGFRIRPRFPGLTVTGDAQSECQADIINLSQLAHPRNE